ncbi:hypothetical protein AcV7_002175 [Taiwanofungus camphoratus]|nr:hypothetical protein AcV7_002175 [Antrodia cinnamomea]
MSSKLSPQVRRWRTIIVTIPIIGATSLVLYKRLVLGEPRRTLPRGDPEQADRKIVQIKPEGIETRTGALKEVWGKDTPSKSHP